MKRDAKAIQASLVMDRERRILFVEGIRDRNFLIMLVREARDHAAEVIIAERLDIEAEGGARGKVLAMVGQLLQHDARMLGFVDADYARFLDHSCPARILWTDYRDLEGYLLSQRHLAAALGVGLAIENQGEAALLLDSCEDSLRDISAVRISALRGNWGVSISNLDMSRYVEVDRRTWKVVLKTRKLITAGIQNAGLSGKLVDAWLESVSKERCALNRCDDYRQVFHGKDFISVATKWLESRSRRNASAFEAAFWSTATGGLEPHPNLASVLHFLSAAQA